MALAHCKSRQLPPASILNYLLIFAMTIKSAHNHPITRAVRVCFWLPFKASLILIQHSILEWRGKGLSPSAWQAYLTVHKIALAAPRRTESSELPEISRDRLLDGFR
ncbi:hypothetical protein BDW74DRAFT_121529 [Aspergillus multicolor]|uniref:uncharacterized protein n=1 Tax=Aspergillus multicolor TaxID=41759 RepID=UPI003CCCC120